MQLEIFDGVPDVFPVALGYISAWRMPLCQEPGKDIPGKIPADALGDPVEDLRLHNIYTRVDRIAEHFTPGRLLQEPGDLAILIRDHNTEGKRVMDSCEDHGGQFPTFPVEFPSVGQIEVGDNIAAYDEEGLVENIRHAAHGSGCPKATWRVLVVCDLRAEILAVPEVLFNGLGEEVCQHQDPLKTMPDEQSYNVLEHGAAGHRHHGLGPLASQRSKPRPVSARHDRGLQRFSSPRGCLRQDRRTRSMLKKGKVQLNTLSLHILEQVTMRVKEGYQLLIVG